MKVGMQKVNDNEWLVQMGNAIVRLDRFTTHLLRITLKYGASASADNSSAMFNSYLAMTRKLDALAPNDWSKLLDNVSREDLRVWLCLTKDNALKNKALEKMGAFAETQMRQDMSSVPLPPEKAQTEALFRFIKRIYELEDNGEIEFFYDNSAYL
ncbi:FliG C-terminal domain-containing protein [Thiomicrospira sp. ALE5]|uniref:FliG C-terminal domain-containing protein n=1 Tax=Thiomicrospira sp. ALE5 TaxID=748650 RepID=UPI0008E517A0|nr:FliG C-terminal domain-containing protein [Thiomicrospira sp. ALE5]SFR56451.1 FliG C-terminal domain-containing protein [Thiomicrospira sp. ALE5]